DQYMRGHAEVIAAETGRMLGRVGDAQEIDLLDFLAELTIYTSSACLIGKAFREELGPGFASLYADLERGTDALAYVNPHLPLPSFRRRDRARARLVELMQGIIDRRARAEERPGDLLDVLTRIRHEDGSPRFDANTITGMFISMMFAGHHTTSGTAAWTLIELLRHPAWMARVVAEQDALAARGEEPSYQALRAMPVLEAVLKETLRLHPPLILLMRKVVEPFAFRDHVVEPGALVGVSPAVSNRMPEHFPEPERFDPERYGPGREEDRRVFAWIPFGAGRHRCVGAAFAMMQLKAIFAVLLRRRAFALAQAPESYRDDLSKMVIQLAQPARVRMEPRAPATAKPAEAPASSGQSSAAGLASAPGPERAEAAAAGALRVEVDLDLCQGHGTCVAEAPDVFALDKERAKVRLLRERPGADRHDAARAAARHCPTRAITLREE
ncbi:MAG: cytochrome P450, partial [Myxococcota bacterium]|nr:cytochrome P450 [Myxococcota bacterium]